MFDDLARLGSSAAGDYEIEKSLRFDDVGQSYLSRTFGSNSSDTSKTFSFWAKRSTGLNNYQTIAATTQDGYIESRLQFSNNGAIKFTDRDSSGGSTDANFYTNSFYTDTSAWMHIVLIIDTTNGTSGDRLRIYVNGSRVTSLTSETQPSQNYAVQFMRSSAVNFIGAGAASSTDDFGGYLADIYFFDGSVLEPGNFGETDPTTGQWIPKAYSGAGYGTNGFHLKFDDNSDVTAATLGKDSAGSNDWTPNSFSVSGAATDSFEDTPTNNFPTLNWHQTRAVTDDRMHSAGLAIDWQNGHDNAASVATFGMHSGKWYFEVLDRTDSAGQGSAIIGIFPDDYANAKRCQNTNAWPGLESGSGVGFNGADQWYINGSNQGTYGGTWAENDIIGVAVDIDAGKIALSKNGQWADGSGNYDEANINAQKDLVGAGPYYAAFCDTSASHDPKYTINFGQRAFSYSIPTGYQKLCSKNLPDPTIKDPTDHFNTILYTGNATSRNIVSGFDTGLVWIKRRSGQEGHVLANRVIGADSFLSSNSTAAVNTANNCVTAFNSDGVTVGTQGIVNDNNETFVSWHWNVAGTASTNSTGTINVSLIANPTAGFSIGTYGGNDTGGATIGHGLGVAPDVVIVKWTNGGDNWCVYNKNNGDGKTLWLDDDGVVPTGSSYYSSFWNDTAPSSTVTTLGSNGAVNGSSRNYLVLSFASVEGYSKFGGYTGNGQTDGPYVYTGFKPAYVLVKRINGGPNYWNQHDNKRNPYNVVNTVLYPNSDDDEESYAVGTAGSPNKNFYSNGFKLESTHSEVNGSGDTYFYMAFAETPFKYATAR